MNTFLVIDIGGTHLKFALMENGIPRTLKHHFPASALHNSTPVNSLAKLVHHACRLLEISISKIDTLVATVPSFLDPDLDRVHFSRNIPQLNGLRLASELSTKLHLPTYLERDVILLLQGEWKAGAGQHVQHLLGIFFGTGGWCRLA